MTSFRTREILGGIFVLLCIGIVLATVVFVGEKTVFCKKVTYHILFDEVAGLKEGAQVNVAGVSVGYVEKIELVYRNQMPFVSVTAKIFEQYIHQIRRDSVFGLSTVGVLGDTVLTISPGTKDYEIVSADQEIRGSSPYSLKQLTGGFDQVVQEIARFSKNVDAFLQTTQGEISRVGPQASATLRQLEKTGAVMEGTTADVRKTGIETLVAVRDASRSIERLANDLNTQMKKGKLLKFELFSAEIPAKPQTSLAMVEKAYLALLAIFLAVCLMHFFLKSLPDVRLLKRKYPVVSWDEKEANQRVEWVSNRPSWWVDLATLPKFVPGAFVVSEDWSFYAHEGVDWSEVQKALEEGLEGSRRFRGASTITQQLARNIFLSQERSLLRKIREILLSYELEREFSKRRILECYLNIVELGPNLYGLGKASRHYFSVSPAQLGPRQAAFLAMLLPNPKVYSQSFRKRELSPYAKKTVAAILRKMQRAKLIDEELYQRERVARFTFEDSFQSTPEFSSEEEGEEESMDHADLVEPREDQGNLSPSDTFEPLQEEGGFEDAPFRDTSEEGVLVQ